MMNSSFLGLLHTFLALLATGLLIFLGVRFKRPRETVGFLGFFCFLFFVLYLWVETLSFNGIVLSFYYGPIYGVLLSCFAMSFLSFTYLSLAENPSRLERKVMWRVPVIGALWGHYFSFAMIEWMMFLSFMGVFFMMINARKTHRYSLRQFVGMISMLLVYKVCLTSGKWWISEFVLVFFLLAVYRFLSGFLVKNLMRLKGHAQVSE